jgi:hypothetical protein
MNDPRSTSAPVLKPFDAASLYQKQGEFTLQPLLEKKQKMQQAQSEFAGVMSEIEKFSNEVWEQDWQQISQLKEDFMGKAAESYEKAYMDGRDMSVMERYQVQKGLGEIGKMAGISKQNKDIYDHYSKEIVKNPEKYDVQSSLGMLNQGYREKKLGERSIDNFLVPRFDVTAFMKSIPSPSITVKRDSPQGGRTTTTANIDTIRELVKAQILSDPVASQYVGAMEPQQANDFVEYITKLKAGEVDVKDERTSKDYTPKYKVSTALPDDMDHFEQVKQKVVQITTPVTARTIKRGTDNIILTQIGRDKTGNLRVIGYIEFPATTQGDPKTNKAVTIPYEDIKAELQGIGGDALIKEAEKLGEVVSGGGKYRGK